MDDLVTDGKQRGKGYGQQIMAAMKRHAKEDLVRVVTLLSGPYSMLIAGPTASIQTGHSGCVSERSSCQAASLQQLPWQKAGALFALMTAHRARVRRVACDCGWTAACSGSMRTAFMRPMASARSPTTSTASWTRDSPRDQGQRPCDRWSMCWCLLCTMQRTGMDPAMAAAHAGEHATPP